MKYRIFRGQHQINVRACYGKPEQILANVTFQESFTASQAVKRVAEYVQAVRDAETQARSARVNTEVNDDGS